MPEVDTPSKPRMEWKLERSITELPSGRVATLARLIPTVTPFGPIEELLPP